MKLNINTKYLEIYNYIVNLIEQNTYTIFDGEENRYNKKKTHRPTSEESQELSLCKKEFYTPDDKLKDSLNFENSNDYFYFEMIINGFIEKYNVLNDTEKFLLKEKLLNKGIFFEASSNVLIIGLHKKLLLDHI